MSNSIPNQYCGAEPGEKNLMSKSTTSIQKRLAMYTSAAGATVVAGGAMAEVIDANISETVTASNGSDSVMIDVNGDGTDNFQFWVLDNAYGGSDGYGCGSVAFWAQGTDNGIAYDDSLDDFEAYAALIAEGSQVDASLDFNTAGGTTYLWGSCYEPHESLAPGNRGFIGFQFEASGDIHYGYADVEVQEGSHTGIIHAVFYESDSDTPIRIGQEREQHDALPIPVGGAIPLGLLLFAAGATALRRRNRQLSG